MEKAIAFNKIAKKLISEKAFEIFDIFFDCANENIGRIPYK